jgi:hypothetical protein
MMCAYIRIQENIFIGYREAIKIQITDMPKTINGHHLTLTCHLKLLYHTRKYETKSRFV